MLGHTQVDRGGSRVCPAKIAGGARCGAEGMLRRTLLWQFLY